MYITDLNKSLTFSNTNNIDEDFQGAKKLIETKMTQSSICHQKI